MTRRRGSIALIALLGLLTAAAGAAWACTPASSILLSAPSGPPGREIAVQGGGYPPSTPVTVRWGSSTGTAVAGATTSAQGTFSADFTIPDVAPDTYTVLATAPGYQGEVFYAGAASVVVTAPPSLTLTPSGGLPSSKVAVTGEGFGPGTVELRWDSEAGPMLASTDGPDFSVPVDIPSGARGRHTILATGRDMDDRFYGRATAVLDVMHPGYPLPVSAARDTVGPAIAAAALSRANRNRTVSRKGFVTLFCGRFEETGVTGSCGARSLRSLRSGARPGARRKTVLALRDKTFSAQTGKPVRIRFRLPRKSMQALKRARKARMRGTVISRDRARNQSKATFPFTLKAPAKKRRAATPAAPAGW